MADSIKGLTIIPNYITEEDEQQLIEIINAQEWDTTIKRATQHYGYYYNYDGNDNIFKDIS